MENRKLKKALLAWVFFSLVGTAAYADGGFSLYGSYWDTDDADETFGGGLTWTIPLGEVVGLDLRAAYYEELTSEPFENLLDRDRVFEEGLEILPLELGVRFGLGDSEVWSPFIGAGATYYLLDSERAEVKDEVGFYGSFGAAFGDKVGPRFFAEAVYRQAEGTLSFDPDDLGDLDDVDIDDNVDIDLSGFSVNVGIAWSW